MKTIQEALQNFLIASEADGLKETSLKWYRSILHRMAETLGVERTIDSITTDELRALIVSLKSRHRYEGAPQKPQEDGNLSGDTIASHVRALHRFWKWCNEEYEINNPMQRIKRHKAPSPSPKAINYHDFITLFEATGDDIAGARDRAILCLLADTGARLGGITSLQVSDVSSGNMRAFITEKGDKRRWIYWTHYTQAVIENYLKLRNNPNPILWINMNTGEQLTTGGIYQIIKRLKIKTGVRGRTNPHSFRHNFARAYLESGGDIVTLAKLMGHSNISTTTNSYAVFSGAELQELHNKKSPLVMWLNLYREQPENF